MRVRLTGIKVSPTDKETATRSADQVQSTPLIKVLGHWLPNDEIERHATLIDDMAVKYGLPPPVTIRGEVWHYGMTDDGEFSLADPNEGDDG